VATRYGAQVDRYLLWNEPNQKGWLQPQWEKQGRTWVPVAPHTYRKLVLAAEPAVHAADPGAEVVIVFPHWGTEYDPTPFAGQQKLAHAAIDAGADPRAVTGKAGSTPLHLAVAPTGAGGTAGSGELQLEIIRMLLAAGATLADADRNGVAVADRIPARGTVSRNGERTISSSVSSSALASASWPSWLTAQRASRPIRGC